MFISCWFLPQEICREDSLCLNCLVLCIQGIASKKGRQRQWWVWRLQKTDHLWDLEKRMRTDSVCPWQSKIKTKTKRIKKKKKDIHNRRRQGLHGSNVWISTRWGRFTLDKQHLAVLGPCCVSAPHTQTDTRAGRWHGYSCYTIRVFYLRGGPHMWLKVLLSV